MNTDQIRQLLGSVANASVTIDEAVECLKRLPFEKLPYATIDHHRAIRCGHPEVIFCPGKTVPHVVGIAQRLSANGQSVLLTRANAEQMTALREAFGERVNISELGRVALVNDPGPMPEPADGQPRVALISAGTADLPVAEEAAMTLRSMRAPMSRLNDVGVSGLHRLLSQMSVLQAACAVVVVAGMEGALPSVVGGLVACPVFAAPTSVGYGASFGGVAALLGALNSCAPSVVTVNIDNGFGAAFAAALVHQQVTRFAAKAAPAAPAGPACAERPAEHE